MSADKKTFLKWWIGGILIFAVSIFIHGPLATAEVPGGILDHQAARNAAEVDAIQFYWAADNLIGRARMAMISDLVFIVIYGIGAFLGGRYFYRNSNTLLRSIGAAIAVAGLVFLATDLVETSLQLVQLMQFAGDDTLASIASNMGPTKVATFLFSFFGLLALLVTEWFSSRAA